MSFVSVAPLFMVLADIAAAAVGALVARRWRHGSQYRASVLIARIVAWSIGPIAALAVLPVWGWLVLMQTWLAFVAGAGIYIRSRWSRDDGVGELGSRTVSAMTSPHGVVITRSQAGARRWYRRPRPGC